MEPGSWASALVPAPSPSMSSRFFCYSTLGACDKCNMKLPCSLVRAFLACAQCMSCKQCVCLYLSVCTCQTCSQRLHESPVMCSRRVYYHKACSACTMLRGKKWDGTSVPEQAPCGAPCYQPQAAQLVKEVPALPCWSTTRTAVSQLC